MNRSQAAGQPVVPASSSTLRRVTKLTILRLETEDSLRMALGSPNRQTPDARDGAKTALDAMVRALAGDDPRSLARARTILMAKFIDSPSISISWLTAGTRRRGLGLPIHDLRGNPDATEAVLKEDETLCPELATAIADSSAMGVFVDHPKLNVGAWIALLTPDAVEMLNADADLYLSLGHSEFPYEELFGRGERPRACAALIIVLCMSTVDLTGREHALLTAFVAAWEASSPGPAHEPFVLDSVRPFAHPNWPGGVAAPRREEVRRLGHLGWLARDERAPRGTWCHYPTAAARDAFGGGDADADGLADPDRRLGVILEAIVAAFRSDVFEPLHLAVMDHADYVQHPHWRLQPNAVREHDIAQLEDVGLVATRSRGADLAFWPTPLAGQALSDVLRFLEQLADSADDEPERSRIRALVARMTESFAVSAVAGTASGAVIRALMGS
jgi:hypothetical protein